MKVTTLLSLYSIYIHIYICISVCLSMCAHNIFVITFSKPSRKHFSAVSSLFWTLWAHGLTTGWAGMGWVGVWVWCVRVFQHLACICPASTNRIYHKF